MKNKRALKPVCCRNIHVGGDIFPAGAVLPVESGWLNWIVSTESLGGTEDQGLNASGIPHSISKRWSMFYFFRTPGRISCCIMEFCQVAFNSYKRYSLMAPSEFMKWIYSSWPENMQEYLMPRDVVFLTSSIVFIYSSLITHRWVLLSPSSLLSEFSRMYWTEWVFAAGLRYECSSE